MMTGGQDFLEKLAKFPPRTFEARFLKRSLRMGLGKVLAPEEMRLLYRAAFRALLCNIAFNGLGGCDGLIRRERELNRVRLEHEFMAFRNRFYACTGWKRLRGLQREGIDREFLAVAIADENLAW